MSVSLLAILVGSLLIYAGVKGKSVAGLLTGSLRSAPTNPSLSS